MTKDYVAPAPFTDEPMPAIERQPVESAQIASIGYSPELKTLAVTFTRGLGAIYHYPNVEPQLYYNFVAAESKGKFFGLHIKSLPFKKFAPPEAAARPAVAPAPASRTPWPFPSSAID